MAAPRKSNAMAFPRPECLRLGVVRTGALGVGLTRLGLLVGILAIIAGIFGMHVITATHAGHASAAVTSTSGVNPDGGSQAGASAAAASPDHSSHRQAATPAPDAHPVLVPRAAHSALTVPPVCSGSRHDAPGMAAMAAGCVLAPGNTSLTAPLPGTARLVSGNGPQLPGNSPWPSSYVPSSPSPGELSISRT